MSAPPAARVPDALLVARLLASDPHGFGGVVLRGAPTPARDEWIGRLRAGVPDAPWRRLTPATDPDRLLGGLDVGATLQAGRPVFATGVLAEADGGFVTAAMAERLPADVAGILCSVLDEGAVTVERDGFTRRLPGRFGLVALDEGLDPDERLDAALAERLAFSIDVACTDFGTEGAPSTADRSREMSVALDDSALHALCTTAAAFGIGSARATLFAARAARGLARLAGRDAVATTDLETAARLVLAPRARCLPAAPEEAAEPPPQDAPDAGEAEPAATTEQGRLEDRVLDATASAIPPALLAELKAAATRRAPPGRGRGAATAGGKRRGRPLGARRTAALAGQRVHLLATLKAAVPWQRVRAAAAPDAVCALHFRRDDLRVMRFTEKQQATTLFVVDASGSQAAQRLAEVKGAVEVLLSECYVRRDEVALIAFRETRAEVLLPPTRALARVRARLAALPGGGGTPLAAGLDAAAGLVEALKRRGQRPSVVLLTDGRANIARNGAPDRDAALADALDAAQRLAAIDVPAILIDTSRRPRAAAQELAARMRAVYEPLPYADAAAISGTVRRSLAA